MVLPVISHRLTKIRSENRIRLIKTAFVFSLCAAVANLIAVNTNNWLNTREVLKYYVFPNRTIDNEDKLYPPTYYKNSTLGPWRFCWSDPVTDFHCTSVDPFNHEEDTSDVTTSVELSVRRAVPFMLCGCALDVLGLLCNTLCLLRSNPYQCLFVTALANIFAGLVDFNCIILYMASLYKASELDNSLFDYTYGFSFILLKISFLCTELAALLIVIVYMSKRDERTYNAHRMRSILRSLRGAETNREWTSKDAREQQLLDNERYHRHTRMNTLRRHSRSIPIEEIQQMNGGGTIAKNSNASLPTLSVPGTSSIVLNAFDVNPN
ncbi:hypothetical protein niasHS_018048 [Heterodera schachtii]|uniref:Uncharacterized protein n=1 Tax=Heterodera schachtii TaxID=97005 RepID=A0ABD2HZM8_HETSC